MIPASGALNNAPSARRRLGRLRRAANARLPVLLLLLLAALLGFLPPDGKKRRRHHGGRGLLIAVVDASTLGTPTAGAAGAEDSEEREEGEGVDGIFDRVFISDTGEVYPSNPDTGAPGGTTTTSSTAVPLPPTSASSSEGGGGWVDPAASAEFVDPAAARDPINLLFIVCDQLRFDTLRYAQDRLDEFKSSLKVETPNIDRLAGQGAYYETAYWYGVALLLFFPWTFWAPIAAVTSRAHVLTLFHPNFPLFLRALVVL